MEGAIDRNFIGLAVTYTSALRIQLPVHGTAHLTSTTCVRPRSTAGSLIRSAVDIPHPHLQGNIRADMPAASGHFHSRSMSMALVQVRVNNVVASTSADDVAGRHEAEAATAGGDFGRHVHACPFDAA